MSQRAIGAQVDLHHDTVGQSGEAAAEVLGVADEARVQTGFG